MWAKHTTKLLALLAVLITMAAGAATLSTTTGCGEECLVAGENCACNGTDCLSCCDGMSCTRSAGSSYSTCKY